MERPLSCKDLYIAKPCHENWEGMDASERGRFCQSCQKEVIDFSQKTEAEMNAILQSGTWSGCGRFYVNQINQIGRFPVVSTPKRNLIMERWRKGAAAAILLVGLWQIPMTSKAEPKYVSCLVQGMQPNRTVHPLDEPNYLVAAVLMDLNGQNLPDDILVRVILPNGESIPIVTERGFFSIDLEGRANPEDIIVIKIENQIFGHNVYHATSLMFPLFVGANYREMIDCSIHTHWDFQMGSVDVIDLPSPPPDKVNTYILPLPRTYGEPLFGSGFLQRSSYRKASSKAKKTTQNED